ncbi:MAG: excinuclease ABC subunit A [Lentisphaerae bacterium]|nr:excinuclease ABC subunit A [Lentisphaerota bacterium]
MIHFRDQAAAIFWETDGRQCRQFSAFAKILMRKLRMLDAARQLSDLRVPPGNKLERLQGNREGQYSIRINDQYRICFIWTHEGAKNVEIVDYH